MAFDPDQSLLGAPARFDPDAYLGAKPAKIGMAGFGDTFRAELAKESPLMQSLVGFGTAAGNAIEGVKQIFGQGNQANIEANKIMEHNAPVSAFAGNVATTAVPFGLAGNSLRAAGAVGAGIGFLNPVEGEQTLGNIAQGKAINTAIGAATGAAGQVIANKAGGYIADKLAGVQQARIQNAPIDQTLQDAISAGLVVPPSSVNPTFLNTMKEGVSGKIATAQVASNRNAPIIDDLARQAVGLPKGAPLTSDAMQAIRGQAYKKGYEPIATVGAIPTDNAYQAALDAVVANRKAASNSFPNSFKDEVTPFIDSLRVGGFDAGEGLKATQILRDSATDAFKNGNADLGRASRSAAKAIEDQIERHLARPIGGAQPTYAVPGPNGQVTYMTASDLLQNFRDARQLMAKAHTVEDAIVEGGGTVNARKMAQRVQAGKPMTGELATIGNFANNFPRATHPATQVSGPGVSKLTHLASLMLGGGGGAALGGPVGGIAGAAAMETLPYALRARMLSKGAQQAALDSKYAFGVSSKLARLLQYSPVAGTVLGLETLGQ